MLEVLNCYLFVALTVLCFLTSLVPHLVKPILSCLCQPSPRERDLWSQMMKLKQEQKAISMKDEFAAYSRIQRKISKLETDLKESTQARAGKNLALKGTLSIILQAFVSFFMLCAVIWFRYDPLIKMNVDLSPVGSLLSYPTGVANSISAHMWVVISNFSIRTLLKSNVG